MTKLFIAIFIFVGVDLHAQEIYEFYNGSRNLGMGGVRVATVNDETSLIQNPAALGKLRDYFITIADPEIAVGADNERILGTAVQDGLDIQAGLDKLIDHPTKHLHTMAQVFPSMVFPNFGFGFIGKYRMDADIINQTNPTPDYQVDYQNDIGFVFGFNFRMFDGRVKLGFNTRVINRLEVKETVPTTTTGMTTGNLGKEGMGVGSDVGLLLAAPWKALPTLGVVVRDVGHTHYNFQEGLFNTTTEFPDAVPQSIDVGLSIFPILGKGVRSVFSIEVRDVENMSDYEDKNKLYHFGMEFNFYDAFFLRGGYNQRYWTAGMEFAVGNYQLQLASYGEEIGTADVNKEDRRYLAKFAYRF